MSIPPELTVGPPELETRPRRVQRASWREMLGDTVERLFILPHMLVGLGVALVLIGYLLWLALGSNVSAQVTSIWTSSSKKGTTYYAGFELNLGGVTRRGTASIDTAEYKRLQSLGSPVRGDDSAVPPIGSGTTLAAPAAPTMTVRTFGVGDLRLTYAANPGSSPWTIVLFLTLFGTFWNGIMIVFVWGYYFEPWRRKRLYRWGLPAPGVIEEKAARWDSKSTTLTLYYAFCTPDGAAHKGKHSVSSAAYARAEVGQSVTVLHFEGRGKPSVVYEYGGFRCV